MIEINAYSNLEDNLERQDRKSIVLAYSYSLVTCLPISLCPGDGAGLGGLWGREEAQKALEQAKFQVVSVTEACNDGVHLMCVKPMAQLKSVLAIR